MLILLIVIGMGFPNVLQLWLCQHNIAGKDIKSCDSQYLPVNPANQLHAHTPLSLLLVL